MMKKFLKNTNFSSKKLFFSLFLSLCLFSMLSLTGLFQKSFKINSNLRIESANMVFTSSGSYNFQWNVTLNGNSSSFDEGKAIAMDSQGYIYVSGVVSRTNTYRDIILIKYDQSGNVFWNRTFTSDGFHSDYGYGIALDTNNVYVVGSLHNLVDATSDFLLLKYTTNGTLLLNKTWGGINGEQLYDIVLKNNHLYVVGETTSWGSGQTDLIIEKLDLSGNRVWNYTWGGAFGDTAEGIYVNGDDIYITGSTYNSGQYDVVIMRLIDLGSSYSQIWEKTWGGPEDDEGRDIALDSNNSIYITGATESFGLGEDDAFLLKYSPDGNNIWNRTWGDSLSDNARGITIDQNNNIFITGKTESNALDFYWDIFIVQYDIYGNQPWYTVWHGGRYHRGYDILTYNNDIYATGEVQYTGGVDRNILLLKYSKHVEETTAIPGFEFPIAIITLVLIVSSYLINYIPTKKIKSALKS